MAGAGMVGAGMAGVLGMPASTMHGARSAESAETLVIRHSDAVML